VLALHASTARQLPGPRNPSTNRSMIGCKRRYDCGQSF
jgi:hypothetical protein